MNTEDWRVFLHRMADLVADHLEGEAQSPVQPALDEHVLLEGLGLSRRPAEGEGRSGEEIWNLARAYLDHSVRTHSPRFANQLYAGLHPEALLGEMLAGVGNASMATFEITPAATLIEEQLVKRLIGLLEWEEGEGIMLTGGSNANMVAMLCARGRACPDCKRLGLGAAGGVLQAFVSRESHYSMLKAAQVLGIGAENLIHVPTDASGRMDPLALEEALEKSRCAGAIPFFIGATAGTTVRGAFDPLKACGELARRYGAWFHVDAAWGGAGRFSPRFQPLMEGVAEADSVTWDAHKLMGVPLVASFLLVHHPGTLWKTNSGGGREYLFHDEPWSARDLGDRSLQCGRKTDAVKVWLLWERLGNAGYRRWMEHLDDMKQVFLRLLEGLDGVEVLRPCSYLNVCFRFRPPQGQEINAWNRNLRRCLIQRGQYMINMAVLPDKQCWFRMVFAHPGLEETHLAGLVRHLEEIHRGSGT